MNFLDARMPQRFWDKLIPEPNSGCWLWFGATHSGGYGVMTIDRRQRYVHRLAYEALVGPIPSGLQIDHLCRTRCCSNPAHLEPVTVYVNAIRGVSPVAANMNRESCVHGHALTGENVRLRSLKNGNTSRMCVTCIRDRSLARSRRKVG